MSLLNIADWIEELTKDNAKLRAENERLRKAGDAMLGDYLETGVVFPPSQAAWKAAKEGSDSQ